MPYGVFESTNMKSTKYAERIFDAVSDKDVENGTFGYLTELAEGEDVTYKFVAGFDEDHDVVVTDQPAWTEDTCLTSNQRKDKFIIPAGTRFRVRVVSKTDEFAINAECVIPDTRDKLKVGAYLTIDAGTGKLVASATNTTNARMEAKVMRTRITGGTLATAANTYGYSRQMFEAKVTGLCNCTGIMMKEVG